MTDTLILLARRPVGWVDAECFRIEPCPEPDCGPGDVLVEALRTVVPRGEGAARA